MSVKKASFKAQNYDRLFLMIFSVLINLIQVICLAVIVVGVCTILLFNLRDPVQGSLGTHAKDLVVAGAGG
ncbi:hypothetical protein GX90_27075 [Salmonella enterica subsp. enterica]|nr:hypothetical protein [Salmonella enterica subsp. enterica serovar Duisburg]EAS2899915.1 hypothetical protein [Salmonella enterica]EAU0147702.1 hypothetical protein [Salmonella enterica]EBN8996682.1 hypothetical protein [Salmonella enterica]OIN26264.1 hypothetical protein AO411_2030205 [Salmonella enterica subsp. enterica serovar Sarajane]